MRIAVASVALLLAACAGSDPDAPTQRRCPAARVEVSGVRFDQALMSGSVQTVEFRNGCTQRSGDLALSLTTQGEDGFSVSPAELSLSPGDTAAVEVTYAPTAYGAGSGSLVAATNDPDVPELMVGLSGVTSPDQDGDGFTARDAGGTDCDDFDPDVHPGAPEVWYDDVDQNCDGASDHDQDKDGVEVTPRGEDCDDTDPSVFPGAPERDDAVDQDCDGWADEGLVQPNDVVVTEAMAEPLAVDQAVGEWFEVQNLSFRRRNLRGWRVTDFAGDSFVIEAELVLEPGGRAVFGASGDPEENGGVPVDVVYARESFELDDDSDVIALELDEVAVTYLEYDELWPVIPAASLSLDPQRIDKATATRSDSWCPALAPLSGGDRGTPGTENDRCSSVDHDFDGFSEDDGDCDDAIDTVYPGADEAWNGVDDDCDEVVDNGGVAAMRTGYVDGEPTSYLSHRAGLSVGDVDEDGDLELIVGTIYGVSSNTGMVFTLDAADASTWAGPATDHAEALVVGRAAADNQGQLGRLQRDVTGDGGVDLVLGGNGYASFGGYAAVALFSTGRDLSGDLDVDDADAVWIGSECWRDCRAMSHLDMDGDGVAEIVFGDPERLVEEGRIYLLDAQGASGVRSVVDDADVEWQGVGNYQYMGSTLDAADLDGDGYDELIACGEKAFFVYYGAGGCGILAGGALRPEGGGVQESAVASVGGVDGSHRLGVTPRLAIGDFDRDFALDLVIPDPVADQVLVFFAAGSLAGQYDTDDADLVIQTSVGPSYLGAAVAVGDFDGDLTDDLAVGAPDGPSLGSTAADEAGRVWLWTGAALSGVSTVSETESAAAIDGESVGGDFGWALLAADLDGDGDDELVIGEPDHGPRNGRVSILFRD